MFDVMPNSRTMAGDEGYDTDRFSEMLAACGIHIRYDRSVMSTICIAATVIFWLDEF